MSRYAGTVGAATASSAAKAVSGGASEDMFLKAFETTPKLELRALKKLENELTKVVATISNPNADWDNRVQAIKHFRSLVNSGIADHQEDFHTNTLRSLEIPFQNNICDLRSQVVRETCITIAFLSCRLQQKFCRMAEVLLPSLIKLIPNCAKIVSTSALVALRFIIQSTHNSKFIPIIKYQLSTSKSKEIHRALCEMAERMTTIWSPATIERQLPDLQEIVRLGICDSDELARQFARRAFNNFAEHFKEPAERLFNSLDPQRQRMLSNLNHGGGSTLSINGYGSTSSSLNTVGLASNNSAIPHTNHNHHHTNSQPHHNHNQNSSNLQHGNYATLHAGSNSSTLGHHSNQLVSRLKSSLNMTTGVNGSGGSATSRIRPPAARSTSAIDVNAQRRARARAVYLGRLGAPNSPAPIAAATFVSKPIYAANSQLPTPTRLLNNSHTFNTSASSSSAASAGAAAPATPLSDAPNNSSSSVTSNNKSNATNNTHYATPGANNVTIRDQNTYFDSLSSNCSQRSTPSQQPSSHQQPQQQVLGGGGGTASGGGGLPPPMAAGAGDDDKQDGEALCKAAAYLMSVIKNESVAENQLVSTLKYFNTLIDKQPPAVVSQCLPELMPPLVIGIDNPAICVRKASVFTMVGIHAKIGMKQMEDYLTGLTMTQRKLLEVYIKKFKEEN